VAAQLGGKCGREKLAFSLNLEGGGKREALDAEYMAKQRKKGEKKKGIFS